MSSHPDPAALEVYVVGRSPQHEIAAIEEHLLTCEWCRSLFTKIELEIKVIRQALSPR